MKESHHKQKVYELVSDVLETAMSHGILPGDRYHDFKSYMDFFSKIINRKVEVGKAKTKAITLYYLLAVSIGPRVTQDKLAQIYSISPSAIRKTKKNLLRDSELSFYLNRLLLGRQ